MPWSTLPSGGFLYFLSLALYFVCVSGTRTIQLQNRPLFLLSLVNTLTHHDPKIHKHSHDNKTSKQTTISAILFYIKKLVKHDRMCQCTTRNKSINKYIYIDFMYLLTFLFRYIFIHVLVLQFGLVSEEESARLFSRTGKPVFQHHSEYISDSSHCNCLRETVKELFVGVFFAL